MRSEGIARGIAASYHVRPLCGQPERATLVAACSKVHDVASMSRKFQVFISSTYTDLRDERQAAVQAVLEAGHIPAGMELFAAGDQAQLEVIKQWIDESDVYMLILGARYGTIEPISQKSYTHFEYEYALASGKPLFAIYMDETVFSERVKTLAVAIANEDRRGYATFRDLVKSKQCSAFVDTRDITNAVLKTLMRLARKPEMQDAGWVRGSELADPSHVNVSAELSRLSAENAILRQENEVYRRQMAEAAKLEEPKEERAKLAAIMMRHPVELSVITESGEAKKAATISMVGIFHVVCIALKDGGNRKETNKIGEFLAMQFASHTKVATIPMARNWTLKILMDLEAFGLVESYIDSGEIFWLLTGEGKSFHNFIRRSHLEAALERVEGEPR